MVAVLGVHEASIARYSLDSHNFVLKQKKGNVPGPSNSHACQVLFALSCQRIRCIAFERENVASYLMPYVVLGGSVAWQSLILPFELSCCAFLNLFDVLFL